MRRTLQTILLVAAVASAPLAAAAAPPGEATNEPRSFYSLIVEKLREASRPAPSVTADRATVDEAKPMPRLPRWIRELLDLDDAARSTGT